MSQEEKISLLEETLEIEEGLLKPDVLLDDLEDYDSMSKLALIVMFEDEFDKSLTGKQIRELKTVNDILILME